MTLTLPSGKSLISNPLANGGNRVSDILPSVPSDSTLAKFNPATGKWETNTFTDSWSQPGMTLAPGEGAVLDNMGDAFTVLLAGFTPWKKTTLSIPAGNSVVSPALAKGGLLSSRLGLPLVEGLAVKLLNNGTGKYDTYTISNGAWSPAEPVVALGQGFIVTAPSAIDWSHDPTLPQVTAQPTDANVLSGGKVGFIVKAVGEPLAYQWLFDGKPIAGATASAIHLPVVTFANAGRYSVVVNNGFGKTISEPAKLDIYYTLKLALEGRGGIGVDPEKSVFLAGSKATLSASPVTGYSWMHWSGDAASSDETITVTMDAHKTITANFSRDYILPDLSDTGFDTKGRFTFLLSSEPGANCEIQGSTDGIRWYKLVSYKNENGMVRIPMAYNAGVEKQFVRVLVADELAPGRLAGHSLNGVGYVNLDIPPGQSLYHVPLALSGNKTVATLFQGAAKGSKVAILDAETGEWAEGELGDTWSNGAAELGLGSIFKFTNLDTKAFRAVFAGSYPGQGVEVTLAKGTGYFGYPSPLAGAVGHDLRFPAAAPAGTRLGLLQANGDVAWHTYDGASWSPSKPSLATMQAVQVDLAADLTWAAHGMPDFNSKPKLRAITGAGTYLAGKETLLIGLDAVGTPMTIQWTKDNQPIVGATQRQLQLVNLAPSHSGRYAVTLRNPFGIENSNPVEVNVHYSLTAIVEGGDGTIEASPSLPSYPPDTEVTLTAKPGEGLGFDEWEGDVTGSEESVTLVMDDHKTVSIKFLSDNQPPTVAIISPKDGRFFSAPSDVEITLAAADADGSITHVLYERKLLEAADWVELGQAASAAALFTWEGASEGVYEIRATVTDNRGGKAVSAPIQIILTTGNLPPVIVSTSPAAGDFVPVPGKFTFTVVAYDPDGEIKSISVNRGKFVKAHGPTYWTENDEGQTVLTDIRWEAGYFPESAAYKFTVDVEDNQDKVTTEDFVFTINHAPTIELTSPVDGTEFVSPATITLAATASDNAADGALAKVEFFANGELVKKLTQAPFEFAWEGVGAGEYEIIAAVTDRHVQVVETASVKVTVSQGADITLTAPTGDITFVPGETVRLAASVSQGGAAITQVEFFKNDQLIGVDTEAPFELDWTENEPGLYMITVQVTDAKGGSAATSPVEAAVFDSGEYPLLGLRLWLDGSGITQAASRVSAWADRTPFGNSVSQADADKQPAFHVEGANGKPAVVFDGADDLLDATVNGARLLSSDAASLFIVMKQDGASANNAVLGWESDSYKNHLDLLFTYNNQLLFDYGHASEGGRISGPQPERWDDNWNLVEVYRAADSGRVAVGGETIFEGTFADELEVDVDGTLSVGAVGALHLGGAVAEVLIYNRALDSGERETVTQYLGVKYGFIEDVVPTDSNAPTLSAAQLAADGKFRFLVTGDKGGRVVLQFSENLDKWTDLQTYTNESGQLWININRGGDVGRLFFRVRAE